MEPDKIDNTIKRKLSSNEMSRKKLRKVELEVFEDDGLEKIVLGDSSYMLRNLGVGDSDSGVEDIFSTDKTIRQPAWNDEDDLEINKGVDSSGHNRDLKLRKKFADTYGQPSWSKLGKKNEDDDDDAILRCAGKFITKSSYLPKTFINLKSLPFLNCETRNEGPVVKCVEFHPTSTVTLVAGLSGSASIFKVDGKSNNKLASVRFENFPIRCGHFSTDGTQFIVGSQNHSYFYVYDMMEGSTTKIAPHHKSEQTNMKKFEVSPDGKLIAVAGRFGQIHLLSATSKEWIGNLSMNGSVTSITFSTDGSYLYSHGDLGDVYVWDMRSRTLATKFVDEGTLVGTAIAASCDYLATGSSWGVVNLYERPEKSSSSPKLLKSFMHLVTPISSLKFNSTQQILTMCSDEKDNQIKMAHIPSFTVYSNFPLNIQLGRVQNFDFSPSSGYFSCVNNKNTAFLYRLRHFGNY